MVQLCPLLGRVSTGYTDTGLCYVALYTTNYDTLCILTSPEPPLTFTEICYVSLSLELDQMGQLSLSVFINEPWLPIGPSLDHF